MIYLVGIDITFTKYWMCSKHSDVTIITKLKGMNGFKTQAHSEWTLEPGKVPFPGQQLQELSVKNAGWRWRPVKGVAGTKNTQRHHLSPGRL